MAYTDGHTTPISLAEFRYRFGEEPTPEQVQSYLLNHASEAGRPISVDGSHQQEAPSYGEEFWETSFSIVKESEIGTIAAEPTSLIDVAVSATTKRFVDLPDALRRSLVPIVEVYKTFTKEEQGREVQVDLRLRTDPNNNGVNRVDLEAIDFIRKGGNPAEVDTNIEFNIRLSARELGFYFVKQYPKSEQGGDDEFTLDRERIGVAWIDLIKIDPGRELQVGEVGNSELVINEADTRMKVLLGYATPTIKPAGMDDDVWKEWKNIIASQKEAFYLNLSQHQFDFKASGEVSLSIDFIASGNGRMLVPEADILLGPRLNQRLRDVNKELKIAKSRLDIPGLDQEAYESEAQYKTCIDELKEQVSGITGSLETQRDHLINLTHRRLINQITLGVGEVQHEVTSMFDPSHRFTNVTRIRQIGWKDDAAAIFITYKQTWEQHMMRSSLETSDYIYFGDIIEAGIEVLAENGLIGESKDPNTIAQDSSYLYQIPNQHTKQFVFPFSNFPSDDSRRVQTIKKYGGFVLGDITYQKPEGGSFTQSLLKLPISWKLFKEWWDNKVGSKTVWFFRDFITELVTDFLSTSVFSAEVYGEGAEHDEIEFPKFSVVSIPVPSSLVARFVTNNTSSTIATEDFQQVIEDANTPIEAERDNAPAIEQSPDADLSSLLVIRQVRYSNARVSPHAPRLLWGQSTRGILETVSFQREDIPGYAEARLFSDRGSVSNNMMLNEKYNTSLELIGNTAFLPGCQLYLDPRPLDLGFADERGSYARSLGMGGLYIVNYVEHQMDFIEKSWKTTLDTKWESFGDGAGGDNTATDARCLTAAQRVRSLAGLDATLDENVVDLPDASEEPVVQVPNADLDGDGTITAEEQRILDAFVAGLEEP